MAGLPLWEGRMLQGLRIIAIGLLCYAAPFLLWGLLAAVMESPRAFGLLLVFIVIGSIANAFDMQRRADQRTATLRARRAPGSSRPLPPVTWGPLRPVAVTHWHEAVGPHIRRPLWVPGQSAAPQQARAYAARQPN
jgi:hypothetical protein